MWRILLAAYLCFIAIKGLLFLDPKLPELRQFDQFRGGMTCLAIAILLVLAKRIRRSADQFTPNVVGLPHRPLSGRLLALTFKVSRIARKIRRWIFRGSEPKWAADVYGLVSYVSVFGLLPTFAVIIASPEHFFARVPADGSSFNTLYKTPLKLLTSFAALISVAVLAFGASTVFWKNVRWFVMAAAIALPILMLGVCVLTRFLYVLCYPTYFKDLWAVANMVPWEMLRTIISPRTYATIDWRRYYWCGLYFYVYTYLAFALSVVVGVVVAGTFVSPFYGLIGFVICANRWIVYRYFVLLCVVSEHDRGKPHNGVAVAIALGA